MTAYLFNPPSGVPGSVSRSDQTLVEPIMLGTPHAQKYGIPMKINGSGQAIPFAGSETAADFKGVLARAVPGISDSALNQGFDDNIPHATVPQGLVTRGFISVICTIGTPLRDGPVYVRVVAAGPALVGDFEATADGSNNVLLPTVVFAQPGKDAFNNAELKLLGT